MSQSSIFHGLPVLANVKLIFSFEGTSTLPIINTDEKLQYNPRNCSFKNKYGYYCCKNNHTEKSKLCKEHNELLLKFKLNISKILNVLDDCKDNNYTLDSYMKCLFNFFNYCFKHKGLLVSFSLDRLENVIVSKYYEHLVAIIDENITDDLIIYNKSISFEKHLSNLLKIEKKIKTLNINRQIESAKHTLISNKIKIQKLSEIYVKTNSHTVLPVICKGIDSKILSFF